MIVQMARILLFIPMYNCEKQILRVLGQIDQRAAAWIERVVIVNNRSADHGEDVVINHLKASGLPVDAVLLRNRDNYGLGGSHKVAFDYALKNGFDYVVVLHGDDQGHLEDLLPVLQSGDYSRYDCCLGARFQKGSRLENYSAFRTFGNRVYNLLFSMVLRKRIYDLGSGLNLYDTRMLASRFYERFPDNLTFNYCMILASGALAQKIHFFPIRWSEDDQVSNVKMFRQALGVLRMLVHYALFKSAFMDKEHRAVPRERYDSDEIFALLNTRRGKGAGDAAHA